MSQRRRLPTSCLVCALATAGAAHAQFENRPSATQPDNPFDEAVAHPLSEIFAPRTTPGEKRAADRVPRTERTDAWPLLYRNGPFTVDGSFTATLAAFKFRNSQFTPGSNPGWGEFFIEPGLTAQWHLAPSLALYGGAAYMETGTRGTDYLDVANTYHGDMEQLYAGLQWRDLAPGVTVDASYGQRDYIVGGSFLIAQGASNGAQRGATYIGPRAAWANAALLKATWRDLTAEAFWLKPNESTDQYTGTRLAGLNVEWNGPGPLRLAGMYVYVPASTIATRDGLNVYNLRARWHPIVDAPQAWLQGEVVWERKSGVTAGAWYAEFNYNAQDAPWKPLVSLRYAAFSGDDPATASSEGFDPLYFGGSVPDWYLGKLGNIVFANTNLHSAAASLTLAPNGRNVLQLVYLNTRATRTGGVVTAKALANEVNAIWTYTFNKFVNINVFAAYAWPGAGYAEAYASSGGAAANWSGAGTQLNISY